MNDTKEQTKQNLDQILEWVFIQLDIADVEKQNLLTEVIELLSSPEMVHLFHDRFIITRKLLDKKPKQ